MLRNRLVLAASLVIAGLSSVSAGELVIPGTGDGLDMLRHMAAVYNDKHTGTKIILPPSVDSSGGRISVLEDRTLLGRMAVPLTAADEAAGLVSVGILRVPTAFFAHPSVQVSNLTTDQIAGIFAGKIRNWDEVGGQNGRIRVVRRDETDSTLLVLRATMPGWRNLVLTDRSKLASTTFRASEAVSEFEGAIGFGPYSKTMESQFNVIRVDGRHPTDPGYPSFTNIRFVFKRDRITDEAKTFIRFARSPEAAAIYLVHGGMPDTEDEILWGR